MRSNKGGGEGRNNYERQRHHRPPPADPPAPTQRAWGGSRGRSEAGRRRYARPDRHYLPPRNFVATTRMEDASVLDPVVPPVPTEDRVDVEVLHPPRMKGVHHRVPEDDPDGVLHQHRLCFFVEL